MQGYPNTLYAIRGQRPVGLIDPIRRWSPGFVCLVLVAAVVTWTRTQSERSDILFQPEPASGPPQLESLKRISQKFHGEADIAAKFSMLDSWRHRAAGLSYFAKKRMQEESSEMQQEEQQSPPMASGGSQSSQPLTGDQARLAGAFNRLSGGDLSFGQMEAKYLAQNGGGGATKPASSTSLAYSRPDSEASTFAERPAYQSKAAIRPSYGAVFDRLPSPQPTALERNFVSPANENYYPSQYTGLQAPQPVAVQQAAEAPVGPSYYPPAYLAAAPEPAYTALFDKPQGPAASLMPQYPNSMLYPSLAPSPMLPSTYSSTFSSPLQPSPLFQAPAAAMPVPARAHSMLSDYGEAPEPESSDAAASLASSGAEPEEEGVLQRDVYGDPVPLSYPDEIPNGHPGPLTREERVRALEEEAARVSRAQAGLEQQWASLMKHPPPVTGATRPDIVDPDDYTTTSAAFDRKRKEMLAFKTALDAFRSDPEFNPVIVMLAHSLGKYGIPPPESDDIHVWQRWYREAQDKFEILEGEVERMASGSWREDETSWERHHLRRPGAYRTATRNEVRQPDDSFAGRQDVATGGARVANASEAPPGWGSGSNVTAAGGAGDEALRAEVEELQRRLQQVEGELNSRPAAAAASAAATAGASSAAARSTAGGSILAARRPPAAAGAPTAGGAVALPPPPPAVVKWLADAFLTAEQAVTGSPAPSVSANRAATAAAARASPRKPSLAATAPPPPAAPAAQAPAEAAPAPPPRGPTHVACEAGECHPVAPGRPAVITAARPPPAVHQREEEGSPLMQTGPVPGRVDPLSRGAELLKKEDGGHAAAAAAPTGPAAAAAARQALAKKIIAGGTAPAAPAPAPAAASSSPSAGRGEGRRGKKIALHKVFVGGKSLYVPAYDHSKTTDSGWGWLW